MSAPVREQRHRRIGERQVRQRQVRTRETGERQVRHRDTFATTCTIDSDLVLTSKSKSLSVCYKHAFTSCLVQHDWLLPDLFKM